MGPTDDPYRQKTQSVSNQRKDIDSDNKSEVSDDSAGAKFQPSMGGRNSSMLRRKKVNQKANSPDKASQHRSSQSKIEIRGVETIEEFFRPEFAQNTQSLDDINDDSDNSDLEDNQRTSKLKRSIGGPKAAPFPQFSDDDDNSPSNSSGQGSQIDIGKDANKAQFRNMGFPNMNYLDPDAKGPPLQNQTYYRQYEDNQDNDVKNKREELSNAREQMPNNTFIKLFNFLNTDAGEGGATASPGQAEEEGTGYRDSGDNREGLLGPRANNKQDEL